MATRKSIYENLNAGSLLISEGIVNEFHKETGLTRNDMRLLLSIYTVSITSGNDVVASGNVRRLLNSILPLNNNGYTIGLAELYARGLIEKSITYTNGSIKRLYLCLTGSGMQLIKRFNQLLRIVIDNVVLINSDKPKPIKRKSVCSLPVHK